MRDRRYDEPTSGRKDDKGSKRTPERRFEERSSSKGDKRPPKKTESHDCSSNLSRKQRHMRSKAAPARTVALEALLRIRQQDSFARDVIDKVVDTSKLDREDKAFATRLVLGVVQMKGTLDCVIDSVMDSPKDIKPDVRDALRISVYEIIFLDKVDYAAVDQGVELVRWIAPKASGLANFVLRAVVKAKPDFPFGNPKTDIEAYARMKGFPAWLAKLILKRLGPQKGNAFMDASNKPAPVFVALNAIKRKDQESMRLLDLIGGGVVPGCANGKEIPGCYKLSEARIITDGRVKRAISHGEMLVADAASQFVAYTCSLASDSTSLLEIGAGRGTKTILLQSDSMRKCGRQTDEFVSIDNVDFKTALSKERMERFGVKVSEFVTADATDLAKSSITGQFQTVFIDAPCSGLGTLRRHPEIRWRIEEPDIHEFGQRDVQLLESASRYVLDGGVIVYSTCTITQEENEGAIESFLETEAGTGFRCVSMAQIELEDAGCDSHFVCILQKAVAE